MADALRIMGLGMGLVFAAMALVLVAMLLLVRLRDPGPEPETEAASEPATPIEERSIKLRVAMIAAAIARVRSQTARAPHLPTETNMTSPWWAHHQARQLNSLLRKRV